MNYERFNIYGLLAIVGIGITALVWGKITARDGHHDARLTIVYFAGLAGALIGAKIAFLFAEGWFYRDNWLALLSGRSITGGLLGGYAAVEIAKRVVKYPRATGDVFAIIAPIGLILGRIGCLFSRCCPGAICEPHWWTLADRHGVARWPAVPAEMLFNVLFLLWALAAMRFNWQRGNRFHVYLIGYGLFRFGHEFLRDNAVMVAPIGGYHVLALAIAALGLVRYCQRRHEQMMPESTPAVAAPAKHG